MKIGNKAPDFTALTDSGEKVKLKDFRGKKVVLYFYPKDNTPGCTQQACDFRDSITAFGKKNTVVLGVSPDSVASHQKFKAKFDLPFPLLSDPDLSAATAFGVADPATRRSRRAAFVAQPDGRIALAIPFYQPANLDHFEAVFTALGLDMSAL